MSQNIGVLPGVPANCSQLIRDKVEESLSGPEGEIKVGVFGPDFDILESKTRQIAAIFGGIVSATLFTPLLLSLPFPCFAKQDVVPPR